MCAGECSGLEHNKIIHLIPSPQIFFIVSNRAAQIDLMREQSAFMGDFE